MAENNKKMQEITVDDETRTQFLQGLDGKGDIVEGIFKGHEMIDFKNDKGTMKVFKMEIDKVVYFIPSNYELTKKLNKLEEIKKGKECFISIECTGFTKLEGGKRLKNFKILSE